jgi:hypothetical protein
MLGISILKPLVVDFRYRWWPWADAYRSIHWSTDFSNLIALGENVPRQGRKNEWLWWMEISRICQPGFRLLASVKSSLPPLYNDEANSCPSTTTPNFIREFLAIMQSNILPSSDPYSFFLLDINHEVAKGFCSARFPYDSWMHRYIHHFSTFTI